MMAAQHQLVFDDPAYAQQRNAALGFVPQREIVYNQHLPYAECIDNESNLALSKIKTNLAKAVLIRDLRPGLTYWTTQLTRYIRLYGLKFSKKDHVLFVNLLFQIITIPDLEGVLVESFCGILIKLLKKRDLLKRSDVILPWKPLHVLCERLLYSKMEKMGLEWIPQSIDSKLRSLVRSCRSLFSPESTQDMLDEWQPLLCPYDVVMSKGCRYLDLFLPTLVFTEEEQIVSWKLWKDEFLCLWRNVRNGPSWEKYFINLFARCAHNNIGRIEWTSDDIDLLFTRILRSFQLPVGKLQHTTALASTLPMDSCCLWLTSMMGGSSTQVILKNLKCLMEASESYFHPSNYGKWLTHLHSFLQQVSTKFINRVFRERYKKRFWEPEIPESHQLLDSDITEFVEIMKPATLLALYGKLGAVHASRVLQILAYLEPNVIIPSVLEKTYIALNTVTEPHQVRACLSALSSTLYPGIRGYPELRKHILPLLLQCLPGIDPNDLPKTMTAFQFISTCLSLIPVVDCSAAAHQHNLTEEDRDLCYSTVQFEDFVLQYIDRCFVLLSSISQEQDSRSHDDADQKTTHSDNMSEMLLVTSTAIVLQQASKAIYRQCLEKLFQYATTNLLQGNAALSTAGTLFAACAKAQPKEAFALFIPRFSQSVLSHFAENPDAFSEEKIDKQLLWNLKILTELCHAGSRDLEKYKEPLFEVAGLALQMTSKQGYKLGAKILKFCLTAWTSYYSLERRNVSHSFDQDPSQYLALSDWGAATTPWEFKMSWHVPCEEEIASCHEIVDRFLIPHLERLAKFNNGEESLTKEELLKVLHVVHSLLSGSSCLLPLDTTDIVKVERESSVDFTSWSVSTLETLPFYEAAVLNHEHARLRDQIFTVVRETLQKVLQSREDDVTSVCMIIDIYSQCCIMHEQRKAVFDQHWKVFSAYKTMMKDCLHQNKQRNRLCLVDRVTLQHSMRVLALERSHYTRMHHTVMLDLLSLSTSHYMKVRANAQCLFFHALGLAPSPAYKFYLPDILKHLKKSNNADHQQFKGALYLLLGKSKSRLFLGYFHKWNVIKQVWPALISAPHSDKPSITKLYEKLALKIQASFNTIAIVNHVTDSCIESAVTLLNANSLPLTQSVDTNELDQSGKGFLERHNSKNIELYHEFTNDLADLCEGGQLTWRNEQLVLGMLSLLLRSDIQLPCRVTKLFVSQLTNDTLSVRQLGVACVASIMKQVKRSHVVVMRSLGEICGVLPNATEFQPGDRMDNAWHQYNVESLPDTKEKYESAIFVDKTHWGYYCWPKKLKTYAPMSQQPKLDRTKEEMSENELVVFEQFMKQSFVDKLINYMCVENEKGKDKFDSKRMDMFRGLFRNFGDSFLPLFQTHIERLVKEKQETHQRCAAEVITGLVVGSKHWNFEKLDAMWSWLLPALRTAVANISSETMKDWDHAFSHIVQNRDPRRIHWVLDFLTSEPEQPSSSALIESSKLYVLQGGIHQQEWRVPYLLQKMLDHVEPLLGHPYKNIRNRIGSILASIFLYDIKLLGVPQPVPRTPSTETLISKLLPSLDGLLSEDTPPLSSSSSDASSGGFVPPTSRNFPETMEIGMPLSISAQSSDAMPSSGSFSPAVIEQIQSRIKELLPPGASMPDIATVSDIQDRLSGQRLPTFSAARQSDDMRTPVDDSMAMAVDIDSERSSTVRIFKTLMKWLVSAQRSMLQPFSLSVLKLLPLMCKMYPVEQQEVNAADEELHRDTRLGLSCLAQSFVPQEDIPKVIQRIEDISLSTSWHARYSILPYIQVFVYSNLFTVQSDRHCASALTAVILKLLEDEQHEVSQMACVTLSGLLQCKVITLSDDLLSIARRLCKTKLKKKRRRSSQSDGDQQAVSEMQKRVLQRHAGVLIYSACILSSPYSVPNWMPDVIMRLSGHLHDGQPIQGTVRRTFSEFKRTHHDNWHEDKQKFSSDELATLTDLLVSPSYYA